MSKSENAFRTISEVADDLGVQQHVLRFWETKFTSVKPLKRGGGRRYYRPEDVALIKKIHHLLYTEGYTIKGVQKLLKGVSKNAVLDEQRRQQPPATAQAHGTNLPQVNKAATAPVQQANTQIVPLTEDQKTELKALLSDLQEMRAMLDAPASDQSSSDAA